MRNVKIATYSALETSAALEFSNQVDRVYINVDTKSLMLEEPYLAFRAAFEELEEVFVNVDGKEVTKELLDIDKKRINLTVSMRYILKAMERSVDPVTAGYAKKLSTNFKEHCTDISSKGYQPKTGYIRSMLRDWINKPALTEAAKAIFVRNEVENLQAANNEFADLHFENAKNKLQKSDIMVKKERLKNAYYDLTQITDVFSRVAPDKAPYLKLVTELENIIDKNMASVAIRKGQKKSKSELTPAITTVAENNTATTASVKDSEE